MRTVFQGLSERNLERERIMEHQKALEHGILTATRIIFCRNQKDTCEDRSCLIGKQIEVWRERRQDEELLNFLFLEEYVSSLKVLCVSF